MRPSKAPSQSRPTLLREQQLQALGYTRIAGVDEAGRGPLAGPVVAAAVVLPENFSIARLAELNDSKQVAHEVRIELYEEITSIVPYGVGIVEADEIDVINIRQASWRAMQHAVADLERHAVEIKVDYVLLDGLGYGPGPWPYDAVVKGDALCLSIAAASIIAKVTRDRIMEVHDAVHPVYGFKQHKGYPTPEHLKALKQHGPCVLHRKSYEPVRQCWSCCPTM